MSCCPCSRSRSSLSPAIDDNRDAMLEAFADAAYLTAGLCISSTMPSRTMPSGWCGLDDGVAPIYLRQWGIRAPANCAAPGETLGLARRDAGGGSPTRPTIIFMHQGDPAPFRHRACGTMMDRKIKCANGAGTRRTGGLAQPSGQVGL